MSSHDDPFAVLGIEPTRDERAIRRARRELARTLHPDAGGSDARMRLVNGAMERALEIARGGVDGEDRRRTDSSAEEPRRRRDAHWSRRDASSFTIDVLPVESFLALEIVAVELGSIIHDDPPRLIEFTLHQSALDEGGHSWCRCELVPEAGGTTVHLGVGSEPASAAPSVEAVRDAIVAGLNSIDWPPPCEDGRTRPGRDRARGAERPR